MVVSGPLLGGATSLLLLRLGVPVPAALVPMLVAVFVLMPAVIWRSSINHQA